MTSRATEEGPRTMKEIVQKKFLDDVIGLAAGKCTGWMVLVMDDEATRVMSSVLTMYEIMERKVTLVENLAMSRQPFKDMDVVYVVAPKIASVRAIMKDFESERARKYNNVHLFFLDTLDSSLFGTLQQSALLCSKISTLKEINMNFLLAETSVYHLDSKDSLKLMHGSRPDSSHAAYVARKLATLCITLNEHPSVRFQASSQFASDVATILNDLLTDFKSCNPTFKFFGEERDSPRERGQLLICDRAIDAITPIMHEYTYQAMANDLLNIKEGIVSYTVQQQNGSKQTKQAILSEADELWSELRYQHIAKVIEVIKARMSDILQNNASAAAQKRGGEMSITQMADAVRALPEFRQTMSKVGQHVAIAQQCMDSFTGGSLMDLSQLEQTMSTGLDEEGKEFRGAKLVQQLQEVLRSTTSKAIKIRLLAIFLLSQRGVSADDRSSLIRTARLSGPEQQVILNFEKLGQAMAAAQGPSRTGVFGGLFRGRGAAGGAASTAAAASEDDYAQTRHTPEIRNILDQLISGSLAADKFHSSGPAAPVAGEAKAASVRTRRFGAETQTQRFSGGRFLVFIAGGITYSEIRAIAELEAVHKKEILVGGTHILNPKSYLQDVARMDPSSESIADALDETVVATSSEGAESL